jgi:hypothetical protein
MQWKDIFAVPGVIFVDLQYGNCRDEVAVLRKDLNVTIHDWEDADPMLDLDTFAAQISALDLVISVDNSTVHMAGALGLDVWTLLPLAADWRWTRSVEGTPWFPSMKLFRQDRYGEWEVVMQRTAKALAHFLAEFEKGGVNG